MNRLKRWLDSLMPFGNPFLDAGCIVMAVCGVLIFLVGLLSAIGLATK